jgi:DNA polymerase III delta prime subunit
LRARQRENEPSPRKPAAQGASLTVEQVLHQAQTPHLLILGQPGAGKSTLLRQLAERAYDDPHAIGLDRPHLPLLLPLRALARAEGALEERLNQALQNELRLTRPLPDGFLDAWPQQLDTPWLFLLDGLDEVPADMYLSLRKWISDLLAHPNIARVILTSRPSAYTEKEGESSRLSVYEIQPFTRDQTAELARRWFGEDAPAFLQALETVRSSVLTETPLLITIAAKVYLERMRLPERRTQLYQEFVDIWLDEAKERGLRDELDAAVLDLAQSILAHLAMAMTEHPDWTDEKSLIPVVAEYMDEQLNLKGRAPAVAKRFLQVMARRSGVFLKREERYEWVHPTFREYFAALWLNQQLEDGKSFDEVLGERWPDWVFKEHIVMLAEMHSRAADLILWLVEKNIRWELAPLLVYEWWKSINSASDDLRLAVVSCIGKALCDLAMMTRWRFAEALGEIGDPRALPYLFYSIFGDPDWFVREQVAKAMGDIRDSSAVAPLIAVLCNPSENISVQQEACRALAKIGFPAVEPLLYLLRLAHLDKLRSISLSSIAFLAIKALGEIGDPRALPDLEHFCQADEYAFTRQSYAAREAIARIRERMEKTD